MHHNLQQPLILQNSSKEHAETRGKASSLHQHSETGQMAGEEGPYPGFPGKCRAGWCTLGCSHLSLTPCRNSARSWPGSSGEFREGSRAATAGTEQAPNPTTSLHHPYNNPPNQLCHDTQTQCSECGFISVTLPKCELCQQL